MTLLDLDQLATVTGGRGQQQQAPQQQQQAEPPQPGGADFLGGLQQFLGFFQSEGFQQILGGLQSIIGSFNGQQQPQAAPQQQAQ